MLVIENLEKNFGALKAVNNLSMEVGKGDILGFIGPNGAGKTTTIRMISTLLKPSAGTIKINDVDINEHPDEVRSLIGYMPDDFGMYEDLRLWEYLDLFASAYNIPVNKRKQMIGDVLELTDLFEKRKLFIGQLSRGMQQRLCLSKTILHDPQLLLLDEPASGLDPRARIDLKEIFKELKRMGKTIVISSHILPELADFCNKIAIIEQGKLAASGNVQDVVEMCRGGKVYNIKLVENFDEAIKCLLDIPLVSNASINNNIISITWNGDNNDIFQVINMLVAKGFKILAFNEVEVDLEDVFMKVTHGVI